MKISKHVSEIAHIMFGCGIVQMVAGPYLKAMADREKSIFRIKNMTLMPERDIIDYYETHPWSWEELEHLASLNGRLP